MRNRYFVYPIVAILIGLFTLLNSLQFWIGLTNTPKDHIYLGTVHNPGDYFYYLSQFKQGSDRILSGFDLMTGEFKSATFVGWINILLGRLFSIVGIDFISAYQISVLLFTSLLLFLSWTIIRRTINASHSWDSHASNEALHTKPHIKYLFAILTFFLFCISNALPVLPTTDNQSWS